MCGQSLISLGIIVLQADLQLDLSFWSEKGGTKRLAYKRRGSDQVEGGEAYRFEEVALLLLGGVLEELLHIAAYAGD